MRFFLFVRMRKFSAYFRICVNRIFVLRYKQFLLFILELAFLIIKCNMTLFICFNFVIRKDF